MHLLYSFSLKKASYVIAFLLCFSFLLAQKSYALTLIGAKDTVTTSRPSPSTPIATNALAGVAQLTVFNNGSRFLASDSAKIIRATGVVSNIETLSSQSTDLATVYLADSLGTNVGQGSDVIFAPVTAMHTITFRTATNIPAGGQIVITFPGSGDNSASPSASTFAFNGLTSANAAANITYKLNSGGTATCTSFTVAAPSITCITTGADIIPNETVTFLIGCADAGTNSATCTTQSPRLINPTRVNTTGLPTTANADVWRIGITTQTAGGAATLDSSTVSVGTIESVTVRATVDPTLTFTITGLNTGTAINTSNAGCSYNELTNSGVNSTAPDINLGTVANTPVIDTPLSNIAAQRIDISSNGPTGYALTATASSSLLNVQTGYFLKTSTTPFSYTAQAPFFGLHACGQDVPSTFIETGAAGDDCDSHASGSTATECRYAWPSDTATMSTTPLTIASDASGPIGAGSPDAAGDGTISVAYAAGIDVSVPPGEYRSIITYIATPSF